MPHPFFVNNQQGAFSHAPSILYNKNHLFSKNQDFQPKKKIALIWKLGAFDYASFRWDHPSQDLSSKCKILHNKVLSGKL